MTRFSATRAGCCSRLPGVEVDAKIGRRVPQAVQIIQATAADPRAELIVLLVGNSGSLRPNEIDAMVRAAGKRKLVFCTLRLLRERAALANRRIREGSKGGKRYAICDWAALADSHPEWFLDGAHTNAAGDAHLLDLLRGCIDKQRLPHTP